MRIPFTKMHGLGNDFMVLDLVNHDVHLEPGQIRRLADRHFGVGFDQLLQIEPPSEADVDFNYRIFNADGGEVEHCGNGARCFAIYVRDHGLSHKNPIRVKTLNGILELRIAADDSVTVNMGAPRFAPPDIPFHAPRQALSYRRTVMLRGAPQELEFSALSMGNPHAVIRVADVANTPVADLGQALQAHGDFPQGVNVGFMEIVDRRHIRLRVYERGAGETLACGTGACAATVAGCSLGSLDDTVTVGLRGGELTVSWQGGDSPVMMSGPATSVYEGSLEL
ncbi:MAG: hypothetical protein RLZZ385_2611 [Pseudomonadota bacterium]|jgi:diaminopimelate epimerase